MSTDTGERDESGRSRADREAAALARVVAQRAIRRLDILEWVIFLAGMALATLGGALVAWLLSGIAGWDFRRSWIGASVLFFVVPGTIAVIRIKREEREDALRASAGREAPMGEDRTSRDAIAEEPEGDDG